VYPTTPQRRSNDVRLPSIDPLVPFVA
jgi:hypothetical protein